MASVHLKNIRKSFSSQNVIDKLNLDVAEGEFVSILGPSGCGKTTCLRLIAGLELPTGGDVWFGSSSVVPIPPENRDVGMVFQHYALFPHMTVEKNIVFGLNIRNEPKELIQQKFNDIINVVQLGDEIHKYPSELSGGQMQRVALARTLITHPRVLLMDEPFANLDANLRNDMRDFVRSLQQKLQITTILVTHDQQEAMELSDRVAVMFNGKIAQYDTPENLFYKPDSALVAEFLGAVNLLQGRLISGVEFESEVGNLTLESHGDSDYTLASVRPERVKLIEIEDYTYRENSFSGIIDQVKFNGTFNEITLSIGTKTIICIEISGKVRTPGKPIYIQFPSADLWLLRGTR